MGGMTITPPRRPVAGRAAALLAPLALALAACTGNGGQAADPTTTTAAPEPAPAASTPAPQGTRPVTASASAFAAQRVRLVEVANLDQPLGMAAPDGDDRIYIAEQGGRIRALRSGRVEPTPVLDVSGEIISGGEQGLLGLAISPDREYLYVNLTNEAGNTSIREYPLRDGRAVKGEMRELLEIEDFAPNHNGGDMTFGPDGHLWFGTGDGGGGGDPQGNGQRLDALLGKLLRISPRPSGGRAYGIPEGNPFAGRDGVRPEIWAYGLRNPWRFSFDRATGDLWIADVGQNQWEEVNAVPASSKGGENYGWDRMEGTHEFEGSRPEGAVDPVIEYGRDDGCTVIGGTVYRGSAIKGLQGVYLYGDYCAGWVRGVRTDDARPVGEPRDLGINVPSISAFGEDQDGEVYLLSLAGPVYRLAPG
jgi:glucose/arabinose dehydrogenase